MSHPARNPPHLHHQHHNHHLNRIDEEEQEAEHDHHPQSTSNLSVNSEWFQTPKSSRVNDDLSDDEHLDEPSYSVNNGLHQILLPNHQLLSKEMLQRKLRFHFMSPIDKWRIKRRFPLKLLFQLAKIILVTSQIMYLGNEMASYLNYEDNTRNAFREMLLQGWDPTREVFTYPPSTGTFAVYTSDNFYQSLNFAIQQYSNITNQSVGTFGYDPGTSNGLPKSSQVFPIILLEKQYFRQRHIDPSKYIFIFNDEILTQELVISDYAPAGDPVWAKFDAQDWFAKNNFSLNFDTLISLKVRFPLRTIYYNSDIGSTLRCYDLNVTIWYDNSEHDGEIPVELTTERRVHQCKSGMVDQDSSNQISIYRQIRSAVNWPLALNWIVIIFCTLSIILCIRSVYRGQLLRLETDQFFVRAFERQLDFGEALEFLDLWIIMIGINDVLIISGTLLKIKLESSDIISGKVFTDCSLMLGIGNLLVWLGLVRYLTYFASYNLIILTIKKSIPNILRFLLCAALIYSGFCFCGWIVLGPYHLKFRTLSSTSECLFSLMNGDDMFATFFSTDVKSNTIWWFSRIYFYLFISLAIYVIVSLFIAIINDSYESIRDYYRKEPDDLKSSLQKFIEEHPLDAVDGASFTNNSIVDHIHRHVSRWFTCTR